MSAEPVFVGLDIGTSGVRAVAVAADGRELASGRAAMADHGADLRAPATWWSAARTALDAALAGIPRAAIRALAVDGTSGTLLAVDRDGAPRGPGLMYNDPCPDPEILRVVARHAPPGSAAHGATSGLAKALLLQRVPGVHRVLHQADWIGFRLSGVMATDANNALKTGYDPVAEHWPDWIAATGLDTRLLPPVLAPGTPVGPLRAEVAPEGLLVAGTTDGCASFLATGAAQPGDGVTALGTTLTLKILSDRPIFAPEHGIYSHRVLGLWLAGGASNSGGAALLSVFDAETIARLSEAIDAATPSPYDYYPLPGPGERFPVADPVMLPRLAPRPAEDVAYLKGLLDGIARIEASGYARLTELGAPPLVSLRSLGGGAANPAWTALRQRRLGVPFRVPQSTEAAMGAARLARVGAPQ